MKKCKMFLLLLGALLLLSGCGAQAQETADENQAASATDGASESASAADSAARQDEMFTSQDLDASYDAQPAAQIALSGESAAATGGAVEISGGSIRISQSYEGIEGLTLDIAGGEISIVSSDDGLNAAGGNDESGMGGFGGRGRDRFSATEGAYINISGGVLNIDASGDGIDSNGELTVSGGEIYVAGPTSGGDSALDYDGEAVISGGVLVATGSASMAQSFGAGSTQGVIMASVQSDSEDGVVALYDSEGNQLLSHQMNKRFSNVVISCPEIVEGGTYTLQAGGQTTQITMDGLIYGDSGMGRGGFGGRGGGNDRKSGRGGEWG